MQRQTLRSWLAVLALLFACCGQASAEGKAQAGKPQNRVVIQINEDDAKKWNVVLNNIHYVQLDLGRDNVEIEVVAYGNGLGMVTADSLVANRVEEAMEAGVHFVACRNTMETMKLRDDDMTKGVRFTQAGLVYLIQRQHQGWAYLRP